MNDKEYIKKLEKENRELKSLLEVYKRGVAERDFELIETELRRLNPPKSNYDNKTTEDDT